MKYSLTAASLASLAVTSTALVHGHQNAHQHLHERGWQDVDYSNIKITTSAGQCWSAGCTSEPTAAPAAYAGAPAEASVAAPAPAPTYAQPQASSSSQAAAPANSQTSSSGSGSSSGGSTSGSVIHALCSQEYGMLEPQSNTDECSLQPGLPNKQMVKNESNKNVAYICWGSKGSWVGGLTPTAPFEAVELAPGESQEVYFYNTPTTPGTQGGACAVADIDTKIVNGQISNTWIEATYTGTGSSTIDVSKEVCGTGMVVEITTGCGCVSTNDPKGQKCVYQCGNGENTCMYGYSVYDPAHQPTCQGAGTQDGGCLVGSEGNTVVTIKG